MILRIMLLALMAVGIAGFGMVAWITMRPAVTSWTGAEPPPPATQKVLVAAHPLRGGSLLKPEDVSVQEMSPDHIPQGASADTPQARTQLWGAMVRRSLAAGEPVLAAEIMRPGDHGFLAAVLGPDMRAVTVGVDVISGSAGLIWPGDRVDLILTQTMDAAAVSSAAHRFAAETVLPNVRVIAIDQQLVQGASLDVAEPKLARTVTLEVTSAQAERVAVAERLGRLSLDVRSADETTGHGQGKPAEGSAAPETTWAGDVSPALNHADQGAQNRVRVFQGASEGKEFRF